MQAARTARPWNQMIGSERTTAMGTIQRRLVRAPHQTMTALNAIRIGTGIGTGYG
jgi:hypothetical protein